jgi:hypothetical protein
MLASKLALAVASLTLVGLVSLGSVSALPLEEIIRRMQPNANPKAFEDLIAQADDKQTPRPEFGGRSVGQLLGLAWSRERREKDCTKEKHRNLLETCNDIRKKGGLVYVVHWCRVVADSMLLDCQMNEGISIRYCLFTVDRDGHLTQFERIVNTHQAGPPSQSFSTPFYLEVRSQWENLPRDERLELIEICKNFRVMLDERLVSIDIDENPIVQICTFVFNEGHERLD